MAENLVYPKLVLKKKQISVLVEFCLDESIEFSAKQQAFPETDWEVELRLKDFKTAILVGMFLRENRLEMDGIESSRYKKSAAGSVKKTDEKTDAPKIEKNKSDSEENQYPTLM